MGRRATYHAECDEEDHGKDKSSIQAVSRVFLKFFFKLPNPHVQVLVVGGPFGSRFSSRLQVWQEQVARRHDSAVTCGAGIARGVEVPCAVWCPLYKRSNARRSRLSILRPSAAPPLPGTCDARCVDMVSWGVLYGMVWYGTVMVECLRRSTRVPRPQAEVLTPWAPRAMQTRTV